MRVQEVHQHTVVLRCCGAIHRTVEHHKAQVKSFRLSEQDHTMNFRKWYLSEIIKDSVEAKVARGNKRCTMMIFISSSAREISKAFEWSISFLTWSIMIKDLSH